VSRKYKPMLPTPIKKLTLKNVTIAAESLTWWWKATRSSASAARPPKGTRFHHLCARLRVLHQP
jgi:hypothetical protein